MLKIKWLLIPIITLIILYILFVLIAPPIVIKSKNKVTNVGPYTSSPQAKEIIQNHTFIGDLHCDALLWKRNLNKASDLGHVDFPRMRKANVAFQAFTIVTKSPKGQNFDQNRGDALDMLTPLSIGQGQPPRTWFSLINRCLYQCHKLFNYAKKASAGFIVVQSRSDLTHLMNTRDTDRNVMGGMLGVEGGHCLEGDINNLQEIYDAGVRMLGPLHFFDNEMGGSAHGINKGGLTPFGFEVLDQMESLGMIIDVAHSSDAVIADILTHYNGPILSSHTGVRGMVHSTRNLTDHQITQIANRGGLIGVGYFSETVRDLSADGIVETILYLKALVGIEHIALGSDFDGSVTTPFDITGIPLLVDAMLRQHLTTDEINAVLGYNLRDFLLRSLPND